MAPRSASAAAPARDSGEPVVRARLAAITDRCWQCRTKVRGIVGVLVDPARTPDSTGFLPFDDVAEMLADRLDPRALAGRRIGRVAHRESPGVAGGYLANGCIECDALIGRFQLEDLLHEHLQAGGTYAQLDIGVPVELPARGPGAPPLGARLAATRQQISAKTLALAGLFGFSAQLCENGRYPEHQDGVSSVARDVSRSVPPSLPFLCQLLSRNGRSPSVPSPRANSSSPCAREASAKSASTSRSSTTASSSIRPSNTSATTSFAPLTSPSCGAPSRRACGPTPSRPPRR